MVKATFPVLPHRRTRVYVAAAFLGLLCMAPLSRAPGALAVDATPAVPPSARAEPPAMPTTLPAAKTASLSSAVDTLSEPEAVKSAPRRRRRSGTKSEPPPEPRAEADCSVYYVVDEDGIRHIRPECLE